MVTLTLDYFALIKLFNEIKNKGSGGEHGHDDERVLIDVLLDADLEDYILFDTTYSPDHKISNKVSHPFWFPKQMVIKGDLVVLYTKKGASSLINNQNGSTSYFYYWNLDSNVWNDDGDTAILFELNGWQSIKAKL